MSTQSHNIVFQKDKRGYLLKYISWKDKVESSYFFSQMNQGFSRGLKYKLYKKDSNWMLDNNFS